MSTVPYAKALDLVDLATKNLKASMALLGAAPALEGAPA